MYIRPCHITYVATHSQFEKYSAYCVFFSQSNVQYQASLRDQMAYQQQKKQQETAQLSRELEMAAKEDVLYQERLKAALKNPFLDKTHPRRLMAGQK